MKKVLVLILAASLVGIVAPAASAHGPVAHRKVRDWHHKTTGGGGSAKPMKGAMLKAAKAKGGHGKCMTDTEKSINTLDLPGFHHWETILQVRVSWCFTRRGINWAHWSDSHQEEWWSHFTFEGYNEQVTSSKHPKRYRFHRVWATFSQGVCYAGVCYHFPSKPGITMTAQADKIPYVKFFWR